MSIANRNLHLSQQLDWITYFSPQSVGNSILVQTGATLLFQVMPYPATIQSGLVTATGVSAAMQLSLKVQRFVPGAGLTLITVGISNIVLQNMGTSGVLGFSGFPANGSTLLNLLTGDILFLQTSVAASAATALMVELAVKKTQDIVSFNGLPT